MAKSSDQKGVILILVLWSIIIVMLMLSSLFFSMKINRRKLQKYQRDILQKQCLLNGIFFAIAEIKGKIKAGYNAVDGEIFTTFYSKKNLINDVSVSDCGSLLNLNFFSLDHIKQIPDMTSDVIKKIEDSQKKDIFIEHLCLIDSEFYKKKWFKFVTLFGTPFLTFPDKERREKYLALSRSKNIKNRNFIKKEFPWNLNTVPEALLPIFLTRIGLKSSERDLVIREKKKGLFKNNNDLELRVDKALSVSSQEKFKKHFSLQTHFFRIKSVLKEKKTNKQIMTLEFVLQKEQLSPTDPRFKILEMIEYYA